MHHTWKSPSEIIERLPKQWRDLAAGAAIGAPRLGGAPRDLTASRQGSLPIETPSTSFGTFGGGYRTATFPADGSPPGSDYELMREQLLDAYRIDRVLLGFSTGRNNGVSNPYLGQAIVRAMNDWNLDTWLSIPDERLGSVVVIPAQFIDEAVAEIHRVAAHPKIVAGLLAWNSFGKPLGHPIYHPIYEALAEHDLPLDLHIGAGEFSNKGGAHMLAGGTALTYYDFHVGFPQTMMHHLASMIVHGVFEKFPRFKLICIEAGVAWLPWLFSQLDSNYAVLQRECPLLRRLPSEYLRDHVRLTTQPLDTSTDTAELIRLLETVDGIEDLLCFSTDYPHWDGDDPRYISGRLPDAWHEKVFHTNADLFLRWASRSEAVPA